MNQFSRRDFIRLSGATAAGLGSLGLPQSPLAAQDKAPSRADQALAQLLEGNQRFVQGMLAHPRRSPADFIPLVEGQNPLAVIVGCADSRVAPEVVFDQGLGDLFVIRVAGNVISGAGPSVKGIIEYAVAELGAPLVMVLGHSQCGAVKAAIKHIDAHDFLPGSINELVDTIKPAVTQVMGKPGDLLENVIRANVLRGVARVNSLEPILAAAVRKDALRVVGATYDLRSGKVTLVS
jgi:carbonic anhydrase